MAALARCRTLHEIAVIMLVLTEFGETTEHADLAERFDLHEAVLTAKDARTYQRHCEELGGEPLADEEITELEQARQELLTRFGTDYKESYGWASGVGGLRRPNFAQLEKLVKVAHLRGHYSWASHEIHADARGDQLNVFERGDVLHRQTGPMPSDLAEPATWAPASLELCMQTLLYSTDDVSPLEMLGTKALRHLIADAKLAKPRRRPTTRQGLSAAEVTGLADAVTAGGRDTVLDTLLFRLHLETACRRGGALALREEDIEPTTCLIQLREKNDSVRWQPASPTLIASLLAHRQHRGNGKPTPNPCCATTTATRSTTASATDSPGSPPATSPPTGYATPHSPGSNATTAPPSPAATQATPTAAATTSPPPTPVNPTRWPPHRHPPVVSPRSPSSPHSHDRTPHTTVQPTHTRTTPTADHDRDDAQTRRHRTAADHRNRRPLRQGPGTQTAPRPELAPRTDHHGTTTRPSDHHRTRERQSAPNRYPPTKCSSPQASAT